MQIKLVSFQLHLFKLGYAAVEGARSWHKKIWEQHSEDWLHRSVAYLTACEPFTKLLKPGASFREPPTFPGLPRPKWLLSVYVHDVLLCLGEVRAKVTSTYGSILKMDSTKKVCIEFICIELDMSAAMKV